MKKLLSVLIITIFSIAGIVYASSVTTTDGQNFNVTNDGGFTAVMTNQQIESQISQYNQIVQRDSQGLLYDQESFILWNSVEQQAVNAASSYQANGVKGTAA